MLSRFLSCELKRFHRKHYLRYPIPAGLWVKTCSVSGLLVLNQRLQSLVEAHHQVHHISIPFRTVCQDLSTAMKPLKSPICGHRNKEDAEQEVFYQMLKGLVEKEEARKILEKV